ncbi:MAG: GFA family protein [Rhodobacteraceae bacterium]|nr:GFA family protein [Paracoccaceae bacterium]
MCGAVSFTATEVPGTFGACHCEMCRRWTGSALLGVTVPKDKVTWTGTENIAEFQSTSWAKRAWCRVCGSNLYFQFTMDGAWSDEVELPLGLFDDPNGFRMTNEIYIDHKPDSFSYTPTDRQVLTRQQVVEKAPHVEGD